MYGAALAQASAAASPAARASESASAALGATCGGGGGSSMAGRLAAIGLGSHAPSPTPSPIAGLLARRTPPSGTFDFAMSTDAGALNFETHPGQYGQMRVCAASMVADAVSIAAG